MSAFDNKSISTTADSQIRYKNEITVDISTPVVKTKTNTENPINESVCDNFNNSSDVLSIFNKLRIVDEK